MSGHTPGPGEPVGRTTVLAALVFLFVLQALRAYLSSIFGLAYDAVFPAVRPLALVGAAAPLLALAAPLIPLSRRLGHGGAVIAAVSVAAVGRLAMVPPAPSARLIGAAVTVAGGGLFLAKGVGVLERRGVAAGVALALVVDPLLRLAGWSYDLSLRPSWLPVQLALSAAAIGLAVSLRDREPVGDGEARALERRVGGLRLRGGLMLGSILFLEQAVLGVPEVGAAWTGVSYSGLAVAQAGAGALAAALLLGSREPAGRHAPAAALLAVLAAAGALAARGGEREWAAPLLVLGHGAALLLLGRALAPAGGRRGGRTTVVAIASYVVLSALYAFAFFHAFTLPAFEGAVPRVLLTGGLLLVGATLLVPRPPSTPPSTTHPIVLVLIVAGSLAVATGLVTRGAEVDIAGARGAVMPAGDTVRVATYNIHYGYSEDWRYDPEAMARVIEASGADVVALQEVPVGLAVAYGTDLARWLGQRLGMRVLHAPSIEGLLGDAVLTRLPVLSFESRSLPPPGSDRKQVARLEAAAGGTTLRILATHFGLTPRERAAQVAAVLDFAGAGPAILAGDLNAGPEGTVARRLQEAGFVDAFVAAGATPSPTAPALSPRRRIDGVWVRSYRVTGARVLDASLSDHRLVVAAVQVGMQP